MLMQRDKNILIHIEKYKAATILQINKMFFNTAFGYDHARKRLRWLEDNGYLKHYTDITTNQRVYYMDKQLSSHDLMIMDTYANLIQNGCEILEFAKEPLFFNNKIKPDGFFKFKFGGKTRIMLLEVDLTHKSDLKRYETLYDSNELQEKYNTFPPILVVTEFPDRYTSKRIVIKYVDYKQLDLAQKILLTA